MMLSPRTAAYTNAREAVSRFGAIATAAHDEYMHYTSSNAFDYKHDIAEFLRNELCNCEYDVTRAISHLETLAFFDDEN